MRRFPIENIKTFILYRLRYQKLPEWYEDWVAQESRLLKIAQVLGKMEEVEQTVADEINVLWQTLEASGAVETPSIILERIESLEASRLDIDVQITSLVDEFEQFDDYLMAEIGGVEAEAEILKGRVENLENSQYDPSGLESRVDSIESSFTASLVEVNSELGTVEQWLNELQAEVDGYSSPDLGPVWSRITEVEDIALQNRDDIWSMESEVWSTSQDLEDLEATVDSLATGTGISIESIYDSIEHWINRNNELQQSLINLEYDVRYLEQTSDVDLEPLRNDIDLINTELSRIDNRFPPALSRISALEDAVAEVETAVTQIDIQPLVNRVTAVEQAVENIDAPDPFDPSGLQQKIDNLQGEIELVSDSIPSLVPVEQSIQSLNDTVGDIQDSIQSIIDEIDNIETGEGGGGGGNFDPSDIYSRLGAAEIAISTLEGLIGDGEGVDLTIIVDRLDDVESQIAALEGFDAGAVMTALTDAQDAVSSVSTTVDTLTISVSEDIAGIRSDITAIEDTISGHATQISDIEDIVVQHGSDITSLTSRVDSLETDVSALQGQVQDIEQLIGDGSGVDLSELIDRITLLEDSVLALQDEMEDIDVTDIVDSIAALQDRVQALEEAPGGGGGDFDPSDILAELSSIKGRLNSLENFDDSWVAANNTGDNINDNNVGWTLYGRERSGQRFYGISRNGAHSIVRYGMPIITEDSDGYVMVADTSIDLPTNNTQLLGNGVFSVNPPKTSSDRLIGNGTNIGEYKLIPKSEFLLEGLKQLPGYADDPALTLSPDGEGGFLWS